MRTITRPVDVCHAHIRHRPLLDRPRRRVIGCNMPIGNGPLLEQAPAMAQILRELVAGVPAEHLRRRAAQLIERIDTGREREPGDGDE